MEANYFIILYWFCHTSTWICHGCTRVSQPETPSHLPPHTIPLDIPVHQPRASCIMQQTLTGDLFHIQYYTCFNAILSNHPSPSPTEFKGLFYTSGSLLLSHIQGYHYHLSKFHIYVLVYCIGVFLSGLLHSVFPERWYGEGRGRGVQDWKHVYTHGRFMLMYGRTNTVL